MQFVHASRNDVAYAFFVVQISVASVQRKGMVARERARGSKAHLSAL